MRGNQPKRQKHSKTRTGCLTCRRRRIKCDEKRPTCENCNKGPRECNYPPPIEPKAETIKDSTNKSTNSELVRFSLPTGSLPTEPREPFDSIQIDQKLMIESLASPSYPTESLCMPAVLITSGLTPTTYSQALKSQHEPLSITQIMHCIPQSISPRGTRSKPVQFFLQYHHETITAAHYLQWYDYSKLCTVTIFTLAEMSDALQHAMVAFSALIYSIKENHGAREMAFIYYSVALREIQLLITKPTMDMTDCFTAVTTALQLSSFDRFFGHTEKCFRHLKGAAHILQEVTNPVQFCSSVVGRSLLEWFVQLENYCCIITPYELLLPRAWRDEDVRMRHKLAIVEYPRLSDSERKARILDDVWPESWLNIPDLSEIVCSVPELKNLAAEAKIALAIELRTKLTSFEEKFDEFFNLPHVQEVMEPATYTSSNSSKHANCCPSPPFVPYALQFPPAGILRIALLAIKLYIQTYVQPPIYDACDPKPQNSDRNYAIEICRTFAGIEDALGDNPDSCLPLFTALVMAISTCPEELRVWFLCKLTHFEQMGLATFRNPIREYYAKLWNIQDVRHELTGISRLISTQNESEDGAEV